MKLYIANITCGGCARGVTATIKSIDANANVNIDVENKIVDLETIEPTQVILDALAEDGFPAEVR
ncbi:heavy-metal-associated domain-containing protein [Acinetobacter sp. ANC 4648]|uniref:heavy-metal-associated domain-containing protein n=1 Tax=Acinetobacter sp. ANC 4648 TaxID=1977875 RepID=UPI000A32D37B|nr:heavy-metal-associated domain-containing protein [Acinetobacter sp. ANC 4648]OTG80347.1 heavy metal transporter [Acinetobacter sp. ANC 4648]